MDKDTGELNLKREHLSIKMENKIESFEKNLSKADSFITGNFSHEWQDFLIKDEMLEDVFVKEEHSDLSIYKEEIGDHQLKDVGSFSAKLNQQEEEDFTAGEVDPLELEENFIDEEETKALMSITSKADLKLEDERCDYTTNWKGDPNKHLLNHLTFIKTPSKRVNISYKRIGSKLCDESDLNKSSRSEDDKTAREKQSSEIDTSLKNRIQSSKYLIVLKKLVTVGHKKRNHGEFLTREKTISGKEVEIRKPSTSGINQKMKDRRLDKSLTTNPSQVGKFEVSSSESKCSNKIKRKQQCIMHPEIKWFDCSQCSYETNLRGSWKRHSLKHNVTKLFKCSECSYETNQKAHLKVHLLKHSSIKMFKCSECSYETNQKGNLRRHLLNHSGAKLFKCSNCSYETNHKSCLRVHLLNHSGAKMFKCSECTYETNHKGYLKVHLLKHKNAKMFKCSECSYETNQRSSLKVHSLKHSNFKMFKCSECSYETRQKGNLRRHLLKHSGAKLLKCSDCSYETSDEGCLKVHLLNHYSKEILRRYPNGIWN